jgi:hypothetical protein
MTEKEKEDMCKHYLELGMMQGKRKFNSISFVEGISLGISIGYLLFYLAK